MINNTKRPLINSELVSAEINTAVRNAINYTIIEESKRLNAKKNEIILHFGKHIPTFAFFFQNEIKSSRSFDEKFIQAAFEFSQLKSLRGMPAPIPKIDEIIFSSNESSSVGNRLQSIRRGLRIMLLHLWSKNIITLPLNFSYDNSISEVAMDDLLTEAAAFLWNFRQEESSALKEGKLTYFESEIKHYGIKLMWATGWHSIEQINIYEISDLYTQLLSADRSISKVGMAVRNVIESIFQRFPERTSYNADQLELFRRWTKGGNYRHYSFKQFSEKLPQIKLERKQKYANHSSELSRKRYHQKKLGSEKIKEIDFTIPTILSILQDIANKNTHEAAIEYFEKAQGLGRGLGNVSAYPFREHIDITKLNKVWQSTFEGWVKFREAQGYESIEVLRGVLSILSDYLFCYLPWWSELYPNADFKFPLTPAEFTRSKFLTVTGKKIDEAPLAFLDLLKRRRLTENSQGQAVTVLNNFFIYLKGYKHLYPELEDKEINSPVELILDYPKRGRKRKSKTNKVPFPKKMMPYLMRYLYTLEAFGMHLQKLSIEGKEPLTLHHQPLWLKFDDYGFVPSGDYGFEGSFEFKKNSFVITEAPNVYSVIKREIKKPDNSTINCYIPTLSALRMIIVAFENGLRLQSIQ